MCVWVCALLFSHTPIAVWIGNHWGSLMNLPFSLTQWAGRYPQRSHDLWGIEQAEIYSAWTVQFKLIGSHLWSFWNINHKVYTEGGSSNMQACAVENGYCWNIHLLWDAPRVCSGPQKGPASSVCAHQSPIQGVFFNLSFTNEGELLLDTTFNMKTANFWCLSFEQVCFFNKKNPKTLNFLTQVINQLLWFSTHVSKDLPTNDSMKFISRYIFADIK